MWRKSDPRESFDKQGIIVVSNGKFAFKAVVHTKHGWYVHVSGMMNGRNSIHENEDWPEEWYWAHLPGS